MKLNSKNFLNITYEKGKEFSLSPEETNSSFYIHVLNKELTSSDKAMTVVAKMLDEVDTLVEIAKDFLKKILADEKNKYYETVTFFMEFHRDELDLSTVAELFPIAEPSTISFIEMVDYLKIKSFSSRIDEKLKQQVFIMDLSFNPEITDELMVIYFNLEKQIYNVSHES